MTAGTPNSKNGKSTNAKRTAQRWQPCVHSFAVPIRRPALSAFFCLLLVVVQVLLAGAAIAQTYEPQYNQGQQGSDGAQAGGQALNTQNTVPNPYIDAKGFVPIVNTSADVNVRGGSAYGGSTRGIQLNTNDILKRDNPYGMAEQSPNQPRVFVEKELTDQSGGVDLNQQLQQLNEQNRNLTSYVMQAGEQGMGSPQSDTAGLLNSGLGSINETYRGMHQFFNDDLIGNLFSQIGQLIGKWISELINGWIADTVQFLASFLRVFVLNPNIAVNGLNGSPSDGISPYIRQGADVMYGIAVDLLLLLFILAIWKYWAEASWRGGSNLMGAVGRLIFTSGLLLAFPTLYAFEIQITNEMIKAIYFNSSDQVMMLDAALASAIKGGILAGVGGLASAFAPLLGSLTLGFVGATVGQLFAFAGLVIFMVLGGILIAELIYLLVLKAIQTALLTAQYMFAPIFIVFFASPDTENICAGFMKAWIETSLWTFVWVGLLKILVIIMFSDYNPWGKILMAVGVLQMMIQVPTFLARAQISPMSDFISAGLIFGGMMKMLGALGNGASNLANRAFNKKIADYMGKDQNTSRTGTATAVNTPNASQNFSTLSKAGQNDPDAIAKLNNLKNKNPQTGAAGGPGGTTPPGVVPPGGPKPPGGPTPPGGPRVPGTPGTPGAGTGLPGTKPVTTPMTPGAPGTKSAIDPATGLPVPPVTPGAPGTKPAIDPATGLPVTPVTPGTKPVTPGATTPGTGLPTTPVTPGAKPVTPGTTTATTATGVPGTGLPGPTPVTPGAKTPGATDPAAAGLPGTGLPAATPVTPGATPTTPGTTPGTTPPGTKPPTTPPGTMTPGGAAKTMAATAAVAAGAGALAAGVGARAGMPGGTPTPGTGTGTGTGGPGGPGITPPGGPPNTGDPEEDAKKWEEAKLSTGYFSNQNLYGVDAVRGIVAGIKTLGVRVREGQKANSIEGSTRGGTAFINLREGASDAEKARTLMVAGLANRMNDDPAGADAAKMSAINADAGGPKGFTESLMANYMDAQGQDWRSSPIGKHRLQRAHFQQAVKGAEAYLNGQQGNEYTQYLQSRYGRWSDDKDAMATWVATDPGASESAWNPAIGPATDALQASGLAITPATRGAVQNPFVMTMRPGARKAAVRAVLRASMYDPRMDGFDSDTTEGAILLGEIARAMPESYVQTAIALDGVSGGKDLAPDVLSSHAQLASELAIPADATYRASSASVGTVAANITGNNAMRGAKNFEQVRRMAYQQYGPEEGARQFEQVVVASADRVRMMNTAGISTRMMIDPGFSNQLDNFVEGHAGGYVNIDDPSNAPRRDGLQTAIQAAGITVRHLGTAGFTPGRANAVYQHIANGGNPNQISGQEIIVAERLHDSPSVGGRVTTSMVQVLRTLDGGGSGPLDSSMVTTVSEIASQVDLGNARADQAVAVRNVMSAGRPVNRQTVEVAARLQQEPGGFNESVFRVEANLLAAEVVRSPGDAHTVISHAVRAAATERGIDTNMPMNQILGELETRGVNSDWVEQKVMSIQRSGGFDARQLTSPTVFEVAYEAASDFSDNAHRVQSIQVAERVHGQSAIRDESILQTYDTVLEAGVEPREMNIQRFFAARALEEARTQFGPPSGGSCPPPSVRVMDAIRQDSRFRMDNASTKNPPKMDPSLYDDICQRRW